MRLGLRTIENESNGWVEGRKRVIECNIYDTGIQDRVECNDDGKGRNGKSEEKVRREREEISVLEHAPCAYPVFRLTTRHDYIG